MRTLVGLLSIATLAGFSWFSYHGMQEGISATLNEIATEELAKYKMDGVTIEFDHLDGVVSGAVNSKQRQEVREILQGKIAMSRLVFTDELASEETDLAFPDTTIESDAEPDAIDIYSQALVDSESAIEKNGSQGTDLAFRDPRFVPDQSSRVESSRQPSQSDFRPSHSVADADSSVDQATSDGAMVDHAVVGETTVEMLPPETQAEDLVATDEIVYLDETLADEVQKSATIAADDIAQLDSPANDATLTPQKSAADDESDSLPKSAEDSFVQFRDRDEVSPDNHVAQEEGIEQQISAKGQREDQAPDDTANLNVDVSGPSQDVAMASLEPGEESASEENSDASLSIDQAAVAMEQSVDESNDDSSKTGEYEDPSSVQVGDLVPDVRDDERGAIERPASETDPSALSDSDVSDSDVSDSDVSDSNVSDSEVSDSEVSDSEVSDSEVSDSEVSELGGNLLDSADQPDQETEVVPPPQLPESTEEPAVAEESTVEPTSEPSQETNTPADSADRVKNTPALSNPAPVESVEPDPPATLEPPTLPPAKPLKPRERARLGIYMTSNPNDSIVRMVDPDSAADAAEIRVGDQIVQIGTTRVSEFKDVGTAVAKRFAGDVVRIWFRRNGTLFVVDVRLKAAKKPDRSERQPVPGGNLNNE